MQRSLFALLLVAACSDTSVTVIDNPPHATILLPSAEDSFVQGTDWLHLQGTVGDGEQPAETLLVGWLSSQDGELWSGPPDSSGESQVDIDASTLSLGAHTLTLRATDDDGNTEIDTVEVVILPVDAPPEVSITAPTTGDSFDFGTSITFTGQGTDARDPGPDLTYEWESNQSGLLGTGALTSAGTTSLTVSDLAEGSHTITLRVLDTDNQSATSSVTIDILHVNEPPTALINSPSSGASSKVGQTVFVTGTLSDLEDAPTELTATLSSDLDGELATQSPDSSGSVSFSTSALSLGVHDLRLTATDQDGASSYASILYEVYEKNTPPEAPTIVIEPANPTTEDDIAVSVTVDSTDADGDTVTYNYQWYRDSALMSGYTSDTVTAAQTTKHQVWMVEVIPNDGEDDGTLAVASVTVENTAPSITGVTLSSTSPTVNDTLTCNPAGWSDVDGDTAGYDYSWTIGTTTSATTTASLSGEFKRGDDITCTVTPNDGDDTGTSITSATATVVNTPPTVPVIAIDPPHPITTDDLEMLIDTAATDDDGDILTSTITWTVDGATSTSHTSDTVANADTALEERWTVTLTVDDGLETATSDTIEVRIWPEAGDIIVTEFMPDPSAVSDKQGEFVEIYNTTTTDISLDDHTVEDYDYDVVDLSGLTLYAGDYVVLCANAASTANGGITTCDHEVTWGTGSTGGSNQLALANTSDEVLVVNPAGTLDEVVYTSSWVSTGDATSLDTAAYNDIDNDSASNWCGQASTLSGGDNATPGADNDGC